MNEIRTRRRRQASLCAGFALAACVGVLVGSSCDAHARRHVDVIREFGRFPHRNALLGRTSTIAEAEFLKRPDAYF